MLSWVGLARGGSARRSPQGLGGGRGRGGGGPGPLPADPPVLLMDEPFGAIDPIARDRLQVEFRRLQEDLRKTDVFVTHDIDEAVKLGDRIAIFRQGGVLEQHATPAEILGHPATDFVADFVGADTGLKTLRVTALDPPELSNAPVFSLDPTPD